MFDAPRILRVLYTYIKCYVFFVENCTLRRLHCVQNFSLKSGTFVDCSIPSTTKCTHFFSMTIKQLHFFFVFYTNIIVIGKSKIDTENEKKN